MDFNLENYPQDGEWMSAYKWKEGFKKEIREALKVAESYCAMNAKTPSKDIVKIYEGILGK